PFRQGIRIFFFSSSRKTERGAKLFLSRTLVRAAPFALLRNSPQNGARGLLTPLQSECPRSICGLKTTKSDYDNRVTLALMFGYRKPRNAILLPIICASMLPAVLAAKHRLPSAPTKDAIVVEGHLNLPAGPMRLVATREHWRRNYVYLQAPGDRTFLVVDVSDAAAPKLVRTLVAPKDMAANRLVTAVGNVMLLADSDPQPATPVHSLSITDFSDPANPRVTRTFENVSGVLPDRSRGLVFLTVPEGLWILREAPGADVELEEQFDHALRAQ
ncbi:MAG: hypothetical protein ABI165_02335, partial [Bryobacteraceae bacterium]